MAEEKNNGAAIEELFRQGIWFVLAFIALMVLFFVLRPIFFKDLIEPFWDFFGLHNAWPAAMAFLEMVWREFGLFLVFLVIVFFWWTVSQKEPEKKSAKK